MGRNLNQGPKEPGATGASSHHSALSNCSQVSQPLSAHTRPCCASGTVLGPHRPFSSLFPTVSCNLFVQITCDAFLPPVSPPLSLQICTEHLLCARPGRQNWATKMCEIYTVPTLQSIASEDLKGTWLWVPDQNPLGWGNTKASLMTMRKGKITPHVHSRAWGTAASIFLIYPAGLYWGHPRGKAPLDMSPGSHCYREALLLSVPHPMHPANMGWGCGGDRRQEGAEATEQQEENRDCVMPSSPGMRRS